MEQFRESQYEYQFDLYGYRKNRVRNLLKSRQIGFTRYFSAEALVDALQTGENQIFISASRAQAEVFRDYIKGFALDWFDKELKGKDKIELMTDNGLACLYFLSTNSMTAQSYNGNFYFDEYFWTRDFEKLNKVAAAMASQKRFRKTYFSTPSAMSHPAYELWSGERYKERSENGTRRTRDGACIVVVAPPKRLGGQFRVLERIRMHGQSWFYQAEMIRSLTEKYTVDYIGIDLTGPGSGVFEQVQQFYPRATPIHYTLESKTRLVLKAQE
ncbi:hypothetical protein CAPTEDRAFT_198002, partial [Capitella teleta]